MTTELGLLELVKSFWSFLLENPFMFLLTPTIWLSTAFFYEKYLGSLSVKMLGICLSVAIIVTTGLILLIYH